MTPPEPNPPKPSITRTIPFPSLGEVEITFQDLGGGRPCLLLHGGAGPMSVAPFAPQLSTRTGSRVILPTHPGFGNTPRPERLTTVRQLAELYLVLLEKLDLTNVTVIGNSIGGWIAAEMGVQTSRRVGRLVLLDAGGIEVAGHPAADVATLTPEQLSALAYHDPSRFRIDPTKMSDAQRSAMAANRAAMMVYAGKGREADPTLLRRLEAVSVPTLVLWGESDGIYPPEYGRAFADAIPGAQFRLVPSAGHLPQLEAPEAVLRLLEPPPGA